MKHLG